MKSKLHYRNMQNFTMKVNGKDILCDGEGYLLDLDAWSEDYVHASAQREGLELTPEHWEVIYFIRDFHEKHGVQAPDISQRRSTETGEPLCRCAQTQG